MPYDRVREDGHTKAPPGAFLVPLVPFHCTSWRLGEGQSVVKGRSHAVAGGGLRAQAMRHGRSNMVKQRSACLAAAAGLHQM